MPRVVVVTVANVGAVAATGLLIYLTGGLPSQLAHLYYIPVVVSALLLPWRYSLAVALLAAASVSPLPDLAHRPLGLDLYYEDPAPWNLSSSGWIARPLAFVAISLIISQLMKDAVEKLAVQTQAKNLGVRLVEEKVSRLTAEASSAHRGRELGLLGSIDAMILGGATEEESLQQIAQLVASFAGAHFAAIVVPDQKVLNIQVIYGHGREGAVSRLADEGLPLGEGVSGWALRTREVAVSRNVHADPRYEKMREFAREMGYIAAAAAPITLEDEVLAALVVGYSEEKEFSEDEIGTLRRIADQAAIAVAHARQRTSFENLAHDTATALSEVIESRDPYTGGHCTRLAEYSRITAASLGLKRREIEIVRFGAALHDVGKIAVPDAILKKPDKLTPDEYAIIKQHVFHGGQICKRVGFLQDAYPIVYHHHERWDGKGYPDELSGERIPLGARIVAVADAFDAMTNDRPYRRAMADEEAVAILRDGAGSQWDPTLVEKFLDALGLARPRYVERVVRIGNSQ